ncbi:O-methylsterigmatocystin oxidoreductase [Trametes sanguinea]|nr:O-methylsterigmatocystin oxidoreductase [Trametes sanguinea]
MPTSNLGPSLQKLGHKYGEVVYLNICGQPTVVLNSYDSAVALLESRSSNTSDRPRFVMAELTAYDWITGLKGYTQAWRQRRRAFHGTFQYSAVQRRRPLLLRGCRRFVHRLLETPDDFLSLARHMFGATAMQMVYGITISETADRYISIAEKAMAVFNEITVPGRYIVELYPSLKSLPAWLPGMGFKRNAARWRVDVEALRNVPYKASTEALARGEARDSMLASLIDERGNEAAAELSMEEEELFKDVTGLAYITGADTTLSAVQAFFLCMVLNPEAQRKAQEELDAVDSLPYVNVVVKEILRWHTAIPLGIPHRTMEEEEWNGYRIPAGCVIISNLWAMSREEAAYPDPEVFIPERFLNHDDVCGSNTRDPERFQFGFGRRICPGRHLANSSLFITVASVLHAFTIEAPIGEDGKPVKINPAINRDYFLAYPQPFKCRIVPRFERATELIKAFD